MAGSPASAQASLLDPGGGDLPPEQLADPDSRFLDVDGVRVHYKEALPAACSECRKCACAVRYCAVLGGWVWVGWGRGGGGM